MLIDATTDQECANLAAILGCQFDRLAEEFQSHWAQSVAEGFGHDPHRFPARSVSGTRCRLAASVFFIPFTEESTLQKHLHQRVYLRGEVAFENFFLARHLDGLHRLDPGRRAGYP